VKQNKAVTGRRVGSVNGNTELEDIKVRQKVLDQDLLMILVMVRKLIKRAKQIRVDLDSLKEKKS
jgi:hypothetical protein